MTEIIPIKIKFPEPAGPTYRITETVRVIAARAISEKAIFCLVCGHISYNPHDVEERYCGFCHQFHDLMRLSGAEVQEVPDD